MTTLVIRYRVHSENLAGQAFSPRDMQALSLGALVAEKAPEPFVDAHIAATGGTLAQALYLSGLVLPPALCSGLGRCGLCRVRFISEAPEPLAVEHEVLSHHDLDAGWRLACQHRPEEGMHVLVPAIGMRDALEKAILCERGNASKGQPLALAVDLGTTSIHWQGVTPNGATVPGGMTTNPQMGAGSDVISRIACAQVPEGATALRRLALEVLASLARTGRYSEGCLAANPAMAAIFLGHDVSGLARAPYRRDYAGGVTEHVEGLFPIWIPPQVSPFIGGDLSAGYAAIAFAGDSSGPEYPFLLADLGTNGECILALDEQISFAASIPMGPALEGINLTYGSDARPGAVTAYSLTPCGLEPQVMGGGSANGITATGYLSLLRALRAAGILDENGLFIGAGGHTDGAALLRRRTEGAGRIKKTSIRLPGKMFLTAWDVEEILKVKAAFTLAVSRLLTAASLPISRLKGVYLAGSLGTYAPLDALYALGFLPPGLGAPVHLSGNTSLAGARLFLADHAARDKSIDWARRVTTLDLASDPAFGSAYAEHMVFAWRV